MTCDRETCIWFNAFCGRIYRDFINSDECFDWYGKRISAVLNRPARPKLIGEFVIKDISFGPKTPVMTNMQWIPVADEASGDDPMFDVKCVSDFTFQADMCFTITTTYCTVCRPRVASYSS